MDGTPGAKATFDVTGSAVTTLVTHGSQFRDIAVTLGAKCDATLEHTRFEATDTLARWLLQTSGAVLGKHVEFSGTNTLPRVQNGWLTYGPITLEDSQVEQHGRRFLGFEEASAAERATTWGRLRPAVTPEVRAVFDAAPRAVAGGLLHAGKFERYLAMFRRLVLPIVESRDVVERMTSLADLQRQRHLYATRWDSARWRLLFRAFLGRRVMSRVGRERAFFDHVTTQSIGDVFRERARKAHVGSGGGGRVRRHRRRRQADDRARGSAP